MPTFAPDDLRQVGIKLFVACGAPEDEAALVADNLVNTSLMGLESHGVTRYIWYAEEILAGNIKPGSPIRIVKESPTTAIVDCGHNFGIVSAHRMVEIACEKAQQANVACVGSHNGHHVGRLGAWPQKIAENNLIGLATANSPRHGHFVVPFGGKQGRLATNPLAYGVPTHGSPIVLDMSTSMIAEGKIRVLMYEGKQIPPGYIQDADGNPTTDPKAFYGPPRGAILPLGGEFGYKGTGLSLLVEILSGVLMGVATPEDHRNYINGLTLTVVNPEAFCGLERFKDLMEDLRAYVTSAATAPGFRQIMMPGDLDYQRREQRIQSGIPLSDETWQRILDVGQKAGVTLA